ncbi:MAG: ABC transporter substrate-binding protein [Lentisphaerota bacterium]
MKSKKTPLATLREGVFFLAIPLAFLVAGCGRSSLDKPSPGGERVLHETASRIRGFDPARAGDVATSLAVSKIYEGLLQYDYLARPYRVIPLLAEEMPDVSSDGLVYTFKIRRGICFQDDPCFALSKGAGREIGAEDFVYAIKRVADLKTGSTGYWAFNNRLAGLDEFRAASAGGSPTDYAAEVEGVRALDAFTLQLRLKKPFPQLLWVLTMPYASVVAREAVAFYGAEFANHPVGTGPFVLRSWRQNYRYEFVRNPKWRETGRVDLYPSSAAPGDPPALLADAGKPVPFLDRIVQYVVGDSTTAWLMFLSGGLDASEISRDNWSAILGDAGALSRDLSDKGVELYTSPTMDLYFTGFNMDDPVVGKNKKLRQALTCAFDTSQWLQFHHNRVRRPNGPIPPGVAGSTEKPSPYAFNLEKARQLLAEAGYPEGKDPQTGHRLQLTLDLGSAENSEARQAVELLISFMDKIGVVLNPVYNNRPAFFDKIERRQVQMFNLSWIADYPDAENFLQLFYGPNSSPGPNRTNYSNPEFDRLYEQIRQMPDSPERTALYRQMADMIIEDAPWIFTSNPLAYGLRHPWLKNYKYHDFPYGMVKYYKCEK